jgi:hypothetical protein
MAQVLSYFPGQTVTIYLETTDGYNGVRTDSATMPVVTRIIFPSLTLSSGYPQDMTKLDTGLYYHHFILPTGADAVGSYLVDVEFTNPQNNLLNSVTYQVVVTAPFGNYSATIG